MTLRKPYIKENILAAVRKMTEGKERQCPLLGKLARMLKFCREHHLVVRCGEFLEYMLVMQMDRKSRHETF